MIVLIVLTAVVFAVAGDEGFEGFRNSACYHSPQRSLVSAPDGSYGCEIYFSEWGTYYNSENNNCVRHMIRGPNASIRCPGPSDNNFADEQECQLHCQDGCSQPMDVGHCENSIQRYYYDSEADQCNLFNYTGCAGNRNNFEHLIDCKSICQTESLIVGDTIENDSSPECQDYTCNWREWIHYLVLGCVPVKEHGACCPTYFKCNATQSIGYETNNETGCPYNGINYSEGNTINIPNACQTCKCSTDFHGPGSSSCEPVQECDQEVMREQLSKGCTPVYVKDQCCPFDWQCPITDTAYRQQGPSIFHKEPAEKHCSYADLLYPRPYRLLTPGGGCRICTCLTPPYFTCRETVCPPPPINLTTRCKKTIVNHDYRQCCPEYTCWNVLDSPNHVGLPITEEERNICDKGDFCMDGYTRCLVNYTQCYLGECTKTCEICAVPMCRFSAPITPRHDCMTCGLSPLTPEEACAKNSWCGSDSTCVVNETRCSNGYCEPVCRVNQYAKIFSRFNADQVITIPERCTPLNCHVDCTRAFNEDGCPIECICPNTPEKACQYFTCSRGNQCVGKCSDGKCSPTCPD